MRRIINRRPGRGGVMFWGMLPFLAAATVYAIASALRLADNPDDKLLPPLSAMAASLYGLAFVPDQRTGDLLLWVDTAASLQRLGIGLTLATVLALVLGIAIGIVPYVRAGLAPFVGVVSVVPPMALLPVLFIVFGLDELSKVVLIVIGIAPVMVRDIALRVQEIPREMLIKAQTLGATSWQLVTRVVLPQALPRLITAVRLALGPAWLFLISAEAIAATDGLGYRIFLVRRYLAMDVIVPYVAWITLLAFVSDLLLRRLDARFFAWQYAGKGDEA